MQSTLHSTPHQDNSAAKRAAIVTDPRSITATMAVQMPADHAVSTTSAARPAVSAVLLPDDLITDLRDRSRSDAGDLSAILLAAFTVLLARYTNEEALRLNLLTPATPRSTTAMLRSTSTAIDVDFTNSPSFAALLKRLRMHLRHVHDQHGRAEAASTAQSAATVTFTYERRMDDLAPATPTTPANLDGDLRLEIFDRTDGVQTRWIYHADRFEATTITRMYGHFRTLLTGIAENADCPVSHLPLLTDAEQQQVLSWKQTHLPVDLTRSVHELVVAQVERNPEALAVTDTQRTLTYSELNARANQVAHYLQAQGIGPETLVGVCMDRSADMVVACLGILKAGGAYVPLDPAYPTERLAFMLADAQVPVLLTHERLRAALVPHVPQVVCLDTDWAIIAQESSANPTVQTSVNQLAYVIYTSGSTGQPKGVQVEHRSLLNLMAWYQRVYNISVADRATLIAGPAFDAAVFELWPCLASGVSLHVPDETTRLDPTRMRDWLLDHAITVCFLPTPLAEQVLALEWPTNAPLRLLQTGGDKLTRRPQPDMPFVLIDNYGPAENTVVSTFAIVQPQPQDGSLPDIGQPIDNVRTYIVDAFLQPVPIGVPGELCVSGAGLSRGYLNRPELTAEKFIRDPFAADPDARMYRTGDLARYCADGTIECLGRIDHQVKIRGFRIELGEIEALLEQHPGVRDVTVVAKAFESDAMREKRLVAYVVRTNEDEADWPLFIAELRTFLHLKLPEYMVPSTFVLMDALPITPNGKVDRRALPAPELESSASDLTIAPRTPEEAQLAGIWAQVLGRPSVSIYDDFFALGGHSLLAARLIALVNAALNRDIPMRLLFEAPTVAAFAEAIKDTTTEPTAQESVNLADDIVLDPSIKPVLEAWWPTTAAPSAIFLTGVTGFLGAFLLHELLVQTRATIYCLVRATNPQEASRRIQQTLTGYQIWRDEWWGRIVPVVGDLREASLGIDAQTFQHLARTIDVIYHAGAQVNYLHPYATLKAANVQGTVEVLRLACQDRPKPVHYISSIAVGVGSGVDGYVREEDTLTECRLSMGYVQSKWVAEGILQLARQRGLPVTIYRPGRMGSHSQSGVANQNDFFVRMLTGCMQLGLAPDMPLVDNLMPVDYAAQAIVHLSQQPTAANATFHLLNPQPLKWLSVVDTAQTLGYALQTVSYQEWYHALISTATGDTTNMLHSLLPLIPAELTSAAWLDFLAGQTFSTQTANAGLSNSGLCCPVIDKALLAPMFATGVRQGLFAEPALTRTVAA